MRKFVHDIRDFFLQDFSILASSKNRWILIISCALFSTFFLVFYNPLDVDSYKINTVIGSIISVRSAGIVGALVLILTQFGLKKALNVRDQNVAQFISWFALELVIISIVIYLFFGERGLPVLPEFFVTFEKTISLSIIPYTLSCLLIALLYYRNPSRTPNSSSNVFAFLTLTDENGKEILTLKSEDLIYLKSEDNYVRVTYTHNGTVEQKLIRNNLKSLSTVLDSPDIIRIHRSYMVNKPNINSIMHNGRKVLIRMNHINDQQLPVSSSYKSNLRAHMSN